MVVILLGLHCTSWRCYDGGMEDITIVLAEKQPLPATQAYQARERIMAEGATAERARIRQLALDEGQRHEDLAVKAQNAFDDPEYECEWRAFRALRELAALLEDR
jgi:hypothetical protein